MCSYVGRFSGESGEIVQRGEAVVRGAGLLRTLTFRVVGIGYDGYTPTADGVAFASCKFHPYRPGQLALAASASR
jgi:hypothetical protein